MKENLQLTPSQILSVSAVKEIKGCVPICEKFGLTLSDADIKELVNSRKCALSDTGRIEFGGGIIPKLIYAFCDSPFIDNRIWVDTLIELQEAFYYYKGEAEEHFSDDELIEFMVKVFNGRAKGSTEYLIGTSLEELCRYARSDYDEYDVENLGDLF